MKRIACWGCVFGLVAAGLVSAIAALAAAGDSTTGFGRNGKVVTAVGPGDSIPYALIVEPDGKLVAAGESGKGLALARYKRDGSLDTSFGRGGKVTTAIRGGSGSAGALVLQPDGKLVAAGQSNNGSKPSVFTLVRYHANGSLDTSFGRGGKVTTAIGSGGSSASALVLQPDRKLVAVGSSKSGSVENGSVKESFALARYNPDGGLDTSFGRGGKVTTAIGLGDSAGYEVVRQPDGKLVVAGETDGGLLPNGFRATDFALVRYNRDGSLDTSFGRGGKVTTVIGRSGSFAGALILQLDGRLVAAGSSTSNGLRYDFALVRYKRDGSLDTSFGRGGKVTTAIGSGGSSASALVLQPDGKLVAAGQSSSASPTSGVFALARYNTNGTLDTSFGHSGKVTTAVGPGVSLAGSLVLRPDGKLIAAGSWETGSFTKYSTRTYFALVRYNPNGILDNRSGHGG